MHDNIFTAMSISRSGLSAEKSRMNLIANNLANIHTTRGPDGEAFKRKISIFETVVDQKQKSGFEGMGVKISDVIEDERPLKKVYKPGHPDANEYGYVEFPNVEMVEESVDMLAASRAYDANINALKTSRDMINKLIELLSSNS